MCRWYCESGRVGSRRLMEIGCDCAKQSHPSRFCRGRSCGGIAPLAVEGKALGSPRGDWEARAQRVTEYSRTGGSLSAESTVLSYTPWNALSQALICCLTVYPPSTAPAPPLPLRPSSPAHAILLASPPSAFIPTSLALWPQKHTSTHMPSFLSSSVIAYFAYFLYSLC